MVSLTSEKTAPATRPRQQRSLALSAPAAEPGLPSPADLQILAALANGRTYEEIGKRWQISRTAVAMRIRRVADGEPHRPDRRWNTPQLTAIAVRDRWIVWNGAVWIPGPGPQRTTSRTAAPN